MRKVPNKFNHYFQMSEFHLNRQRGEYAERERERQCIILLMKYEAKFPVIKLN